MELNVVKLGPTTWHVQLVGGAIPQTNIVQEIHIGQCGLDYVSRACHARAAGSPSSKATTDWRRRHAIQGKISLASPATNPSSPKSKPPDKVSSLVVRYPCLIPLPMLTYLQTYHNTKSQNGDTSFGGNPAAGDLPLAHVHQCQFWYIIELQHLLGCVHLCQRYNLCFRLEPLPL